MSTQVVAINKSARKLIIQNWKSALAQYLEEDHEHQLRNEYATLRLLKLCGISKIQSLKADAEIIRFRNNMDLKNLDLFTLKMLSSEYSNKKRRFVDARNKRKKH